MRRRRASGCVAVRRATRSTATAGPITMPVATPISRRQRKRRVPRTKKLPSECSGPDDHRAAQGKRSRGGEGKQCIEHERPDCACGDQRRQLIEGAVADPAVVLVVEAVHLHDGDPDRAEDDRPEEDRDVGHRGGGGRHAEGRDQDCPVAGREQAAEQGAAAAGPGGPDQAKAGGEVGPGLWRSRPRQRRGRGLASRGVFDVAGHGAPLVSSGALGLSLLASSRSALAPAVSPAAPLALERR